jgi:hypothetical protein
MNSKGLGQIVKIRSQGRRASRPRELCGPCRRAFDPVIRGSRVDAMGAEHVREHRVPRSPISPPPVASSHRLWEARV